MRSVYGQVLLPPDAPARQARLALIELRDVSLIDAPSRVVAEQRLHNVTLEPGGRIPFKLAAPETAPGSQLSLRVHVSLDGSGRVGTGDLLTTTSVPVASSGDHGPVALSVKRV